MSKTPAESIVMHCREKYLKLNFSRILLFERPLITLTRRRDERANAARNVN